MRNFTVKGASVSLIALLGMSAVAGIGLISHALLAEAKPEPSPEALKEWLAAFAYLAGLILLAVHLVKAFRPEPSADKKFATINQMERVDRDSVERHRAHEKRIDLLDRGFSVKHAENVERLEDLARKLDGNREADHTERTKLREDVRHDVREELQPLRLNFEARGEDAEKEFRKLAGEIGALTNSKENTNQQLGEIRQQLGILLSRTGGMNQKGGA